MAGFRTPSAQGDPEPRGPRTAGESVASRTALLSVSRDSIVSGTWPSDSMAVLARRAGVSRQTLYNEFGSRDGLAVAVLHAAADEFLAGITAEMRAQSDPFDQVVESFRWALAKAQDDVLVKTVLTGSAADLLPFLTIRSSEFLLPLIGVVAAEVAHPQGAWACEVVVRLSISHLMMPARSNDEFLAAVADLIRPILAEPA